MGMMTDGIGMGHGTGEPIITSCWTLYARLSLVSSGVVFRFLCVVTIVPWKLQRQCDCLRTEVTRSSETTSFISALALGKLFLCESVLGNGDYSAQVGQEDRETRAGYWSTVIMLLQDPSNT